MKLIAIAFALVAASAVSPIEAHEGQRWSCAGARFFGVATLAIYPDHVTVETATGFPMVIVRNGAVRVRCQASAPLQSAAKATIVLKGSCLIHPTGRVAVEIIERDGRRYVQLSQYGTPFFGVSIDGSGHWRNSAGCPAPLPPRHSAHPSRTITASTSILRLTPDAPRFMAPNHGIR